MANESCITFISCAPSLRVADVREELLATLTALADFAYGWGLLDAHVPRLQAAVSIFLQEFWPVDKRISAVMAINDWRLEVHPDDAMSA